MTGLHDLACEATPSHPKTRYTADTYPGLEIGIVRWLLNVTLVVLTLAVFFVALLFLLGNAGPVTLDLLITDWQPAAPLGQWLLGFLLVGMGIGLLAGLLLAAGWRRRPDSRGKRAAT